MKMNIVWRGDLVRMLAALPPEGHADATAVAGFEKNSEKGEVAKSENDNTRITPPETGIGK